MSKLSNLKELVGLLSLSFQVQKEVSDILEEHENRLYTLQEDNKRLLSTVRKLDDRCRLLETRYSEVLYKLAELRK